MNGADLIAAERQRQIDAEGWTPEHDMEHHGEDLSKAALCYLQPRAFRVLNGDVPVLWPWAARYWKPTPDDRVRELVKAGALIAAEIDRLASS
jgi:hypothetical protein